ncbi:WD repeat-containing protein 11 [Plakobranchus ocellatus]|uniref:WD repeat-containing protein 11 n=1 Tax=Plakobranchus ocellatus TaxID=259542 RepID=A0AAV4CJ80_9GAST|nr:WD repeat-containing protein 11 [Plakobranchus ocellatus]
MKLYPKIITGALHAQNKDACDWGWQGYLAYGCQNLVTVIEPKSVQVIQVLDKHKGVVSQVKWAHEQYHHDLNSPYTLRLASSDTHGQIIVWDVGGGAPHSEFSDGNKGLLGMQWLSNQDACRDLLVCLHPPYSLILWNADTGTKLWKKSYTETLLNFTFDPFNYKHLAFLGQDCIIFINDFTINKTPSSNGKKFYISNPSQASSVSRSSSGGSLEKKTSASASSSSKNLAKRMSRMLVGESRPRGSPEEESVTLNECLQVCFHRSCRHHLVLLYPREMLILDLEINQTVGIIALDRSSSSFAKVITCWQRDVLMCVHENGGVSVRSRRRNSAVTTPAPEGHGAFDDTPTQLSMEVAYDLRCQSDPLRVTRHIKLIGAALCSISEKFVALIMSDSRVMFWELTANKAKELCPNASLLGPTWDIVPPIGSVEGCFPKAPTTAHPQLTLADTIGTSQNTDEHLCVEGTPIVLKFLLTGLINGISNHITVIKMCPPLTNKNMDVYQPLMALGTHSGVVQIVNVASGQIEREYSIHSSPVRGIEWSGLKTFLSYSHPNPGPTNLVKNELFSLDLTSGKQEQLRLNRDNESPIEMLTISHLKQYFVLIFKDKPLELWDLRSKTIIRELPRHFPRPTAAVWSPSHSLKTLRKKLLDSGVDEEKSQSTSSSQTPSMSASAESQDEKEKKSQSKSNVREHFVMTDKEGTVFHFIVEGTGISDVTKIPPESGLARVTALAWKGDNLIFGDSEGFQCLWDLKVKISRTTPTNRGWIKKIRFAPGRDNLKFFTLHNDGVLIWEIGQEGKSTVLHSIKSPKDITKVADIDWAGSDRPALVTAHSSLHVCDITLKSATSVVEHWDLPEPIFCPHLLPGRLSQTIKCLLQHQNWRSQDKSEIGFNFSMAGVLDNDRSGQKRVAAQLQLVDKELMDYLPQSKFGVAHRCLLVARLFGDESEVHFWTVALHYLRFFKVVGPVNDDSGFISPSDTLVPPTSAHQERHNLVDLMDEETSRAKLETAKFKGEPLERCYDMLCDNYSFKKYELDRVHLQDSKRATMEHTQKCADSYVQLGQSDRAVQLLLETESEAENYYIDCLKACLVASVRSSGASQSTIKLVATNLIASGRLTEGVQLLCLINKGLDACRYLQTYGAWDHAVWLSKASLEPNECGEVMKRWAEYLNSPQINQKSKSVLVLLSLGQFYKVLEMLYSMRNFDRAVLFLEACLEFDLLQETEHTKLLFQAVNLEYARYLINLGLGQAAMFYCHKAGERGEQLLKEVEILFSLTQG